MEKVRTREIGGKVKLTKSALSKFIIWSTSRYNDYLGFGTKREKPWDYPNEALITLCELCHEKTHFRDYLRKNMPKLMNEGFTFGDIKTLENTVMDKLWLNDHKESARRYMDLIRTLVNG